MREDTGGFRMLAMMDDDQEPTDADKASFVRAAREVSRRLAPDLQEDLRRQAEALRSASMTMVELPPPVDSAEARATERVRAEVERLAQITAASGDQIAALVGIARAGERATFWTIVLTVVLVFLTVVVAVLTYVLAAEALHWWPFGLPSTR